MFNVPWIGKRAHNPADWALRCQAAVREPVYSSGKVIGIAEQGRKLKRIRHWFSSFYTYFSVSIPSSFWIIFPLQFPFSPTKSVFFRFPHISVPVSVDGNNYAHNACERLEKTAITTVARWKLLVNTRGTDRLRTSRGSTSKYGRRKSMLA